MTQWPFDKFDMKPGALYEVRAPCSFAKEIPSEKATQIKLVDVKKGEVLMSLGYDEVQDLDMTHRFRFLRGEQIVFLPIYIDPDKYETEEEIIEAIRITFVPYVKPYMSHGYMIHVPPRPTEDKTPHLIGDSRNGDDDWDEFH